MTTPKITFGMIVLNGEPFILYNLRALYPYAHQIIVVEGAALSAKSITTPEGHSTDSTRETIRKFQKEEDIEHKVSLITAEDEGYPNGFWPGEKHEMSDSYAKRATGNYLWQVDCDEFYLPQDLQCIISLLKEDPDIQTISFIVKTFWGSPGYLVDGYFLLHGANVFHRLFSWKPGYRYITHRPPTVVDENGKNLREKKSISAVEMARRGIYLYHYELLFPKQVAEKCRYYRDAEWTDSLRGLDDWVKNSYDRIRIPFRPHMVYQHISWLERFTGNHPPEVLNMVESVKHGYFPSIELRQNEDVEMLLKKPWYWATRSFLKAVAPFYTSAKSLEHIVRFALRDTKLWAILRRLKRWSTAQNMRPISSRKISSELASGWQHNAIPEAQRQLTKKELSDMYAGKPIKPWKILAEAISSTGMHRGHILEVGCSTGYHKEVLEHLLMRPIEYTGLDYSPAMVEAARRLYPKAQFDIGDATSLPYNDDQFDICLSGCVLLHVPNYRSGIFESARVAKKWVIFHRTPIVNGKTKYFRKYAYGIPCVEIHFNEEEFFAICREAGLVLSREWLIDEGPRGAMKTYLYEK
jgi:SAM-dependent methyltransferase